MPYQAVVIGASAGALNALSTILPPLEKDYALPLMVVVHIPSDRKSVLAEILQEKCALGVKEAEDKEPVKAGTIYIAPPDYHLLAEGDGHLSLSNEEPVLYSRPSIDVLFETAADAFGDRLIAIVLTGANEDGAAGARYIADKGGTVIVQNPELAEFATMPQAALDICPSAKKLSLDEIVEFLLEAGAS